MPTHSAHRLARWGFTDPARAARSLSELGWWDTSVSSPTTDPAETVIAELGSTPNPDLVLRTLARVGGGSALCELLTANAAFRRRIFAVAGASEPLGEFLVHDEPAWRALAEPSASNVLARDELRRDLRAVGERGSVSALRSAYRRSLVRIVAADLLGEADFGAVTTALSDLADATVEAALAIAVQSCARADPAGSPLAGLAVIAMGKCGGRELNYLSDVDLLFVAEPSTELTAATAIARELMAICAQVAWPIDANLRPEGRDGPLVRTLESYQSYYDRWARTWEFQALLKARFVAGDRALGDAFEQEIAARAWSAADRPGAVVDIRRMRRRVVQQLPSKHVGRELKLGPGGLRDIEFAVQLLQLVHGRADASLRLGGTIPALRVLVAGGYVGRADGEALIDSYGFLRTMEHRLQLQQLRRVQRVPADEAALTWLARSLGVGPSGAMSAAQALEQQWRRHQGRVQQLHEKLFYRPLLTVVAAVPGEALRMSSAAASARLVALGFAEPRRALDHIAALTSGVSRKSAIQRTLLPAILSELADAPSPDQALLAYRNVCERLADTPWFLRFLRDEGSTALRLAHVVAISRYVAELIGRDPESLRVLASEEQLRRSDRGAVAAAMNAAVARHSDGEQAMASARAVRARELVRVACAEMFGLLDVSAVGEALADLTDATLAAALAIALRELAPDRSDAGPDGRSVEAARPLRITMIGLGRLGGRELSYGSDADVIFVYEASETDDESTASPETARLAAAVANRARELLGAPGVDPPLTLDVGLRPEGRQGSVIRSLAGYAEYYRRWAGVWEAQALLRARPVAGDDELAERFMELIAEIRYPPAGLEAASVTEIRRIKARVETERLPRGADPATQLKLGRGGLADVEWAVQLLQLRNAGDEPALRVPGTLSALSAAVAAGRISGDDRRAMADSWVLASRLRNALTLVRGRPTDQLPRRGAVLAGAMRVLGEAPDKEPGEFLDEYFRIMRLGHQAARRVFGE